MEQVKTMLADLDSQLTDLGDKFGDYITQSVSGPDSAIKLGAKDLDSQLTDLADTFGDYIGQEVSNTSIDMDL